jgi:hypothetical protein
MTGRWRFPMVKVIGGIDALMAFSSAASGVAAKAKSGKIQPANMPLKVTQQSAKFQPTFRRLCYE